MDLDELLPDFDMMYKIIQGISDLSHKVKMLEIEIGRLEAEYMKEALTDSTLWVDGKRPTITYCTEVVKIVGNNDSEKEQINALRAELSKAKSEYEQARESLLLERNKLDLYRTISANERLVHL